jgi:hypothetical protein
VVALRLPVSLVCPRPYSHSCRYHLLFRDGCTACVQQYVDRIGNPWQLAVGVTVVTNVCNMIGSCWSEMW